MEQKRKVDIYVEMALFFVLGVLAGVALKVEASKLLTIGFDDYKMKFSKNQYSINEMQKKANEAAITQEKEVSDQNQTNSNEKENPDDSQNF